MLGQSPKYTGILVGVIKKQGDDTRKLVIYTREDQLGFLTFTTSNVDDMQYVYEEEFIGSLVFISCIGNILFAQDTDMDCVECERIRKDLLDDYIQNLSLIGVLDKVYGDEVEVFKLDDGSEADDDLDGEED
jgi:hypothetical protein